MAVRYRCAHLEGMEGCPGEFAAGTVEELWEHIQIHGRRAHNIDASSMPTDVKEKISRLFEYDDAGGR
ncbi:MAG: DUF1059 domain-containing protein [Chloroflexi bacterium]|nr:DUF1059 domain-containing protein [Chloroflexota bacterium]